MAQKPTFDPGITQKYEGELRRAINPDGTFNVRRIGASWRDWQPYMALVSMRWPAFAATLLIAYVVVNTFFAAIYYSLGPGALHSNFQPAGEFGRFLVGFYFSSHTLTTVGFGSIYPESAGANLVAALEALVGLLAFAVATGVFFGRISRPSARIGFSDRALIAPYQDGTSFQFRIVNRRSNSLTEVEVQVILMTVDRTDTGAAKRAYAQVPLERDRVYFFPLTWTLVHAIDEHSPLFGRTHEDLAAQQAEFLIMVKAWDETFGQTVHQRYSYRYDEISWEARFTPAFAIDEHGDMVLRVNEVGSHLPLNSSARDGA
jgi:inward rectifier potassium channel